MVRLFSDTGETDFTSPKLAMVWTSRASIELRRRGRWSPMPRQGIAMLAVSQVIHLSLGNALIGCNTLNTNQRVNPTRVIFFASSTFAGHALYAAKLHGGLNPASLPSPRSIM